MAGSPFVESNTKISVSAETQPQRARTVSVGKPAPDALTRALEITGVLQTTLELELVVQLFAKEVRTLVAHDGVVYRHPERELEIAEGTGGRHSCSYRLVVGDQLLGEVAFTRNRKFRSEETVLLEYLLCSFVYPLRNALMYREALCSAHRDPLTGAENRASMDTALRREIDLAMRHETPLSMIVVDIDHFKTINDRFGHAVGDSALQAVAASAARTIRSTDVLFRYGGEEFVVLLRNTGLNGALLLAERIRREAENLLLRCGVDTFGVTVSAGVSQLQAGDDAAQLFIRADRGLYLAKQEGRNRVRLGIQ